MAPFNRLRLVHWLLAAFFLLAYLTGDDGGLAHVWLGYGLIAVIAVRLVLAVLRTRGFPPLMPTLAMLRQPGSALVGKCLTVLLLLGILASSATGLMLVDNARILQDGTTLLVPAAQAEDMDDDDDGAGKAGWGNRSDALEEWHEAAANATLGAVGLHVGWLLAFRRMQMLNMIRGLRRKTAATNA